MQKFCLLLITASIPLFRRLALAHLQIRIAPFGRWRAFVERAVKSCYWNTAEAIASGLDIGRTGMQINLPSRLAASAVIVDPLSELHSIPLNEIPPKEMLIWSVHMNRRNCLIRSFLAASSRTVAGCQRFEAAEHHYQLSSKSLLPADIAKTPGEVREAIGSRFLTATLCATFRVTAAAARMDTPVMLRVTSKTSATNWNLIESALLEASA
jgi:hypothetical protein